MGEASDQPSLVVAHSASAKKAAKASKREAKPDKNQYWLLYPTPPDQMRSFSTDRPTKSNVPYTVDAGHFQYETDLVNYTHQVIGSTRTDTLLVPNPTFKIGLTNNADLEVNVPFAGVHTYGSGPSSTLWGIGDTFVRSKINLWANDGGDTAAAREAFDGADVRDVRAILRCKFGTIDIRAGLRCLGCERMKGTLQRLTRAHDDGYRRAFVRIDVRDSRRVGRRQPFAARNDRAR